MTNNTDVAEALKRLPPALCLYAEWIDVGMALKHEGLSCDIWDDWSKGDPARYKVGECKKKWAGFNGADNPVTGATIISLAMRYGYSPRGEGYELNWDDYIGNDQHDDMKVIKDGAWIESVDVVEPSKLDGAGQLIKYIETLFEAGENVGYVVESWEKDGRYIPRNKGLYDRTAGELIHLLSICNGDVGSVVGDADPQGGAWIRFNPLDGKGVKNENVTEFRYALVESDNEDIGRQNAIIRELELPVAALVHSGGKSLHAIVRVDAADYAEYKKRVDYLYGVCRKNGLEIDSQNKNPSRLSRMPGIMRGEKPQYLVDTNIGRKSFNEWREWVEAVNDDLPVFENVEFDNLPELAPNLIHGVLRRGHKMLLAGPSKSGKSFALIELAISIAEGRKWLSFQCEKGRVLYINLEIDPASVMHRFADVYKALGWNQDNLNMIDIWNLRGRSLPLNQLAPKLIRRAQKREYSAIIFDPIYKIITGDENSADQMAAFCNQFDTVCAELGCAVVYCHHHSKGSQAQKRSLDRASGSGVFARDPDTLLDYIELTPPRRKSEDAAPETAGLPSFRIEGTMREFAAFKPVNCLFRYPIHIVDTEGLLDGARPLTDVAPRERGLETNKENVFSRQSKRKLDIKNALIALDDDGMPATINNVANYIGVSGDAVRKWMTRYLKDDFYVDKNDGNTIKEITE